MQYTSFGTIHGRTIELEGETSLPDGMKIRIRFEPIESPKPPSQFLAAIRESSGAWTDADDSEFDQWMESTRQSSIVSRRDEFMDAGAQQ